MKKMSLYFFTFLFMLCTFSLTSLAQDIVVLSQIERLTFTAMKFARTDEFTVSFDVALSQALRNGDITQAEYRELFKYSNLKYSNYLQAARHLAIKAEKEKNRLRGSEESITANLLIAKTYIEIARVFPTPPEPFIPKKLWSAPAQAVRFLEESSQSLGFYQWGGAPRYTIALFNFHIALGFDELRSLNLPPLSLKTGEVTYSQRQLYNAAKDHLESAVSITSGKGMIRQHEFYRLILETFKKGGVYAFRPPIVEWGTIRNPNTGLIDANNPWNRRINSIYNEAKKKAAESTLDSKSFRIARILIRAFTPKWLNIGISLFQELGR